MAASGSFSRITNEKLFKMMRTKDVRQAKLLLEDYPDLTIQQIHWVISRVTTLAEEGGIPEGFKWLLEESAPKLTPEQLSIIVRRADSSQILEFLDGNFVSQLNDYQLFAVVMGIGIEGMFQFLEDHYSELQGNRFRMIVHQVYRTHPEKILSFLERKFSKLTLGQMILMMEEVRYKGAMLLLNQHLLELSPGHLMPVLHKACSCGTFLALPEQLEKLVDHHHLFQRAVGRLYRNDRVPFLRKCIRTLTLIQVEITVKDADPYELGLFLKKERHQLDDLRFHIIIQRADLYGSVRFLAQDFRQLGEQGKLFPIIVEFVGMERILPFLKKYSSSETVKQFIHLARKFGLGDQAKRVMAKLDPSSQRGILERVISKGKAADKAKPNPWIELTLFAGLDDDEFYVGVDAMSPGERVVFLATYFDEMRDDQFRIVLDRVDPIGMAHFFEDCFLQLTHQERVRMIVQKIDPNRLGPLLEAHYLHLTDDQFQVVVEQVPDEWKSLFLSQHFHELVNDHLYMVMKGMNWRRLATFFINHSRQLNYADFNALLKSIPSNQVELFAWDVIEVLGSMHIAVFLKDHFRDVFSDRSPSEEEDWKAHPEKMKPHLVNYFLEAKDHLETWTL
jgi:hypothetical protein